MFVEAQYGAGESDTQVGICSKMFHGVSKDFSRMLKRYS